MENITTIRVYIHHGLMVNHQLATLSRYLRKGVKRLLLVDKISDCNIILTAHCDCELFDHVYTNPEKFIVILDSLESVNTQGWTHKFGSLENVLAVFRATVFRDPVADQQYRTCYHRYHYHRLASVSAKNYIKHTQLQVHPLNSKTYCVPWLFNKLPSSNIPTNPVVPWEDRTVDVCCIIPRKSELDVLNEHHQQILELLRAYSEKENKTVITQVESGNLLPVVFQSKVVSHLSGAVK